MAVGFILPFVSFQSGTDEDGNDWQITRGGNAFVDLARENARNSFSYFVDALERQEARTDEFSIEVELRSPSGRATAVWLDNISISPNEMTGTLTATPPNGLRGGLAKGDLTSFTRFQVLDWRYPEDGRWRGNFVLRVSLANYPVEERARIVEYLHESPIP